MSVMINLREENEYNGKEDSRCMLHSSKEEEESILPPFSDHKSSEDIFLLSRTVERKSGKVKLEARKIDGVRQMQNQINNIKANKREHNLKPNFGKMNNSFFINEKSNESNNISFLGILLNTNVTILKTAHIKGEDKLPSTFFIFIVNLFKTVFTWHIH